MADELLVGKIHDLSDLELAVLICLVAKEHCIIDTEPDALDELVDELELVSVILHKQFDSSLISSIGSRKCFRFIPCRS